jgi:DNA mismatch endonuclease (patch repair protein)
MKFGIHNPSWVYGPDFPRFRKIIFVHGCFWHRHNDCLKASFPKSRQDFWAKKFAENVERDRAAKCELIGLGWEV